jgi:hypothetical protein
MLQDSLGFLKTPASDLRTPEESLRSLFGVQLELTVWGQPHRGFEFLSLRHTFPHEYPSGSICPELLPPGDRAGMRLPPWIADRE